MKEKICPASSDPCNNTHTCDIARLCTRLRVAPIDMLGADHEPTVHFVGFRGEEYNTAVAVFGDPDFVHLVWDVRASCDIAPGDTVVFARYHDRQPSVFNYDDSNQPNDPAAAERR